MKKSELQELIRNVVDEVLNEKGPGLYKIKNVADTAKGLPSIIDPSDETESSPAFKAKYQPVSEDKLKEDNIDEMSNVGIKYVVSPNLDLSKYPGKYGRILTALQNYGEPVTKKELMGIMGLTRQQQINTEFMQLVNLGAIIQADIEFQKAKRILNPQISQPGEEPKTTEPEEETGVVSGDLSDEEIDAMFAKAKAAGEEEPTSGIEKISAPTSASELSDEDYNAFMKYTDLMDRLNSVKGDLNRMKRSRFMAGGGDIKDKPSDEEKRLRDLKASLEQRVNTLVAGSEYLQKRQAKKDELNEWNKKKMQYYAGIIK